ncbi:hypothetical protein [Streptomyces sp. KM273126]|uniref:hypothetical protein n=1 Tax=Streptomyces sp. KM273126 TaxID=2545247 RepID=UPI0026881C07|nr:hypothetical protein [Streptomyces sp. KM273126]
MSNNDAQRFSSPAGRSLAQTDEEIRFGSGSLAVGVRTMGTDRLIRMFTDEKKVRVFAAVALGADTPARVGETAG